MRSKGDTPRSRGIKGAMPGAGGPAGASSSRTGNDGHTSSALQGLIFDLGAAHHWLQLDPRPRVIVDDSDRVLWCNDAAQRTLKSPLPVYLDRTRLRYSGPEQEMSVRKVLKAADGELRSIPLVSDVGETNTAVLSVWGLGSGSERRVFIKAVLMEPALDVTSSGMASHYSLTKAEASVADALLRLETPSLIARRQGVSVHTVRSHIRKIYAKMSVQTQTQMVRLTLAFCGG